MIKTITIKLLLLTVVGVSWNALGQLKSIEDFTKGMTAQSGFFNFYYAENSGKVYLEVSEFDQPFLFQSSLPQGIGSNDIGLDRGQLGDTRLVEFEKFGDKVLLRQLNTEYRVTSDNQAERDSIDEAFADSVIAGMTIEAGQGNTVLVDYTPFLLSDIHGIAERLKQREQGSFSVDTGRSGVYLKRTKAFPDNTEMEALVTFKGSMAGQYVRQVTPSPDSISVHLHHSLVRLPDDNFEQRRFHPFSGFWKMSYQDYSVPIDQPMEQKFIPRHRLNKQDPTAAVSEAVEPIVYYLDPGIPEPVKSALYDGALWWDQAFTAIGYKNAFQVKTLPEGADPMDVRYNVIQWVHRATRGWSYGSSVVDPRSGEIIKGHVTLGSLRVRQDYLIALGLTSPFEGENQDTTEQQEMALARIRQLSAHEVGHTLGIAHNFAASADGRESVMDYPHPLVTVIEGQVSLDNAYATGMGKWDLHTIAYGYQDLPDPVNEQSYLAKVIKSAHDAGLSYQSDPDARASYAANAQGHLWDNGQDPVDELANLMEVRQTALKNFGINTIPSGASFASLQEMLVPIYFLHRYQIEAVAKLLAGVEYKYEVKGDFAEPQGVRAVDSERQRQALNQMLQTLSPDFLRIPEDITKLITPKVYGEGNSRESFNGRTGITFDPISAAEASAGYTLSLLLQTQRLNRMAMHPIGDKEHVNLDILLDQIFAATIQTKSSKFTQAIKHRVDYVVLLSVVKALQNKDLAPEVSGTLLAKLSQWQQWLTKSKRDRHYAAMAKQIDWFMQSGTWPTDINIKAMPPGSPI